jgi:ATP-dependent Lon protease
MANPTIASELPVKQLRWRLDPDRLPFETTEEVEPLSDIIGQNRGVAAFRFGINMRKPGYNLFVTGPSGTGRLATVKRLLEELSDKERVPDDLCYVNNFKDPETPVLIRLQAGLGGVFKKDMKALVDKLKRAVPEFFESQEYINMKKQIMETSDQRAKGFFKRLDQKVKEEGFALVELQSGQIKRPELMPLVDGNPVRIEQLEEMVGKGRFPKDEYETLKEKYDRLREQIDSIFLEIRDLQKEVQENLEKMDRASFLKTASELTAPVVGKYSDAKIKQHLEDMLEDLADNLSIFLGRPQPQAAGLPFMVPEVDHFQPYEVNLFVNNSGAKRPPLVIEEYPTYRNIFGSIERVIDRGGVWRSDFSKIKAGSLLKANGGYLVINLTDAITEPGVWQGLKRALKSKKLEIQTFDPYFLMSAAGLKPEPIELNVKVVLISDAHLYQLLNHHDEEVKKIFKVRADFDTAMEKNEDNIRHMAEFIKSVTSEEKARPFDRTSVASLVEEAVRMSGRQEKISSGFPTLKDIILEADHYASLDDSETVTAAHVDRAVEARIHRTNLVEEKLQEMIDRGTLMIDVEGETVGQVNGLAVFSPGDYLFGKPIRITATTSMGRAGVINIEREADLSGNTHNKGVLILSGYLRKKFAQDKPLTMSASIAFEQSYSGVDGDSASSTEVYALLSSLADVPIRQSIAVTGSVNQKGEIQAIGGVNQKIEGFYDCCRHAGLSGKQGVMIPASNVKDLMLRKDVVDAVSQGKFKIYAVKNVDEGIEILTGKEAGVQAADGKYPEGSINFLVDAKLRALAEGLKRFAGDRSKREAEP